MSGNDEAAYGELLRRVVEAVRAVSGDVVKRGGATLEVAPGNLDVPATVALRPRSPAAAPVTVQVDDDSQLTVYLGVYGTVDELFSTDTAEVINWAAEYVAAVIAGRYRERVQPRETGAPVRAVGELELADRTIRIRNNVVFPRSRVRQGRRYESRDYAPYD